MIAQVLLDLQAFGQASPELSIGARSAWRPRWLRVFYCDSGHRGLHHLRIRLDPQPFRPEQQQPLFNKSLQQVGLYPVRLVRIAKIAQPAVEKLLQVDLIKYLDSDHDCDSSRIQSPTTRH